MKVLPNQWSDTKHVIRHPDNHSLNMRIDKVYKTVSDYIAKLMIANEPFTFGGLDAEIENSRYDGSFIEFVHERIEARTDITPGTRRNHMKVVAALKAFRKMGAFSQVTRANVLEFDQWLHGRGYKQVTVHSYHKFLKVYIHEAMVKELIAKDPYLGIRIEEGRSEIRKYLTEEEIRKISECDSLTPSLCRVRDMFIFQCHTGLAYADLKAFDFTKVVERDGRYVLHDSRVKSQEDFYIVLLSPAIEILKKYDYKLPVISNEQYNMRLKAVADCAKVEKRITSHMARHSFAVCALNAGVPLEVVSKMLGHTNTNTTQIYARIVNKSVESAFDVLQKKIDGEKG